MNDSWHDILYEMPKSRKAGARSDRGWFGIGIERGKDPKNLGTLWRSAVCFGASYVFTVGYHYHRECADTPKSWRKFPCFSYDDIEDFANHRPYDTPLIGIELTEDAKPLEGFTHPERAMYLLGPEDGSLSLRAQDMCQHVVAFRSSHCTNVATAGSIVMYDRQTKRGW